MKRFTKTNEWLDLDGDIITFGISEVAVKNIGEIVNVKLPKIGKEIKKDEEIVILESTKAAIDIYSPVSGKIIAVNDSLKTNIKLVNESPEKEGWLLKIKINDMNEFDSL